MSNSRVKFWAEIKGKGADLIIDKQAELKKSGSNEKNYSIVANMLINELAELKNKK